MKLHNLHLKNIGPFLNDSIEFETFENSKSQVTILTGENGTGKTIIIDAIRKMFMNPYYAKQIRPITRNSDFQLKLELNFKNEDLLLKTKQEEGDSEENLVVTRSNGMYNEISQIINNPPVVCN